MADIGHRQSFIADMPLGSSHSSAVSRNDRSFSPVFADERGVQLRRDE
jgi:hypothetical protein